ncbi:universal stress protein [Bogoriella caseilytica]|uniref:universal stress protein n=1 Tax=Bogoriella caseilytica TaxID=56055 RepID=UPI0011CE5FC3|nr:universal stress protein [Bogoriella caseilytica]
MTRQILVATDGSVSSTAAVEWAAMRALAVGAELRILCVLEAYAPGLQVPPDYLERDREEGERILKKAAQAASAVAPEISVSVDRRTGPVAETILAEIGEASEVVLGSRGRGGFTSLVIGSVSLKVAGHTDKPVVVVRQTIDRPHGTIVVGYDWSEAAQRALTYAFEVAARTGAKLRVINAGNSTIYDGSIYTRVTRADLIAGEEAALRAEVERWRQENPDVTTDIEIIDGHPAWVLAEASKTADLVVVGSRGVGTMRAALLGSVSHGVLHHGHSPVAVIGSVRR